jgi:regulatory protein
MSAKMRAVRIVSASSVSKRDLEYRLVQKGEDPKQAKQAVEWMSDLNLLDDARTAEQIVDRCIRKGYGLTRAKQALYEKRIPKEFWADALADYPDQTDKILEFLRKQKHKFHSFTLFAAF